MFLICNSSTFFYLRAGDLKIDEFKTQKERFCVEIHKNYFQLTISKNGTYCIKKSTENLLQADKPILHVLFSGKPSLCEITKRKFEVL